MSEEETQYDQANELIIKLMRDNITQLSIRLDAVSKTGSSEWSDEVAEELKQAARDLISMVDTIRVLKR